MGISHFPDSRALVLRYLEILLARTTCTTLRLVVNDGPGCFVAPFYSCSRGVFRAALRLACWRGGTESRRGPDQMDTLLHSTKSSNLSARRAATAAQLERVMAPSGNHDTLSEGRVWVR